MITSERGISILKQFEGFSPVMYLDTGGKKSIGYGTLIDTDSEKWLETARISEQTAEILLRTDLRDAEKGVNKYVTAAINQNQFDSLACFTYNVGVGAFRESTLLKMVNVNANDEKIKDQFLRWDKVGKKTDEGLLHRRTAEAMLYFSPVV